MPRQAQYIYHVLEQLLFFIYLYISILMFLRNWLEIDHDAMR